MKLIASFDVFGFEPVPWSVPRMGSKKRADGTTYRFGSGKKSRPEAGSLSLAHWQQLVKDSAKKAMRAAGASEPLTCQTHTEYVFLCRSEDPSSWGRLWTIPIRWVPARKIRNKSQAAHWTKVHRNAKIDADLTNMEKATEDAMEDAVFVNDCLVRSKSSVCLQWHTPGVRISVYEIEDSDYQGQNSTTRSTPDAGPGERDEGDVGRGGL